MDGPRRCGLLRNRRGSDVRKIRIGQRLRGHGRQPRPLTAIEVPQASNSPNPPTQPRNNTTNGLFTRSRSEGTKCNYATTPPNSRYNRGICMDRGEEAWLNLEQVASIIQLHNTRSKITTTLLQGVGRADWNTVWKHMRAAESAAVEETDRPAPRMVRDAMMTYGQRLFQHKRDGISGTYPMNIPGHWRVMILSHNLNKKVLLDPFGSAFTPVPYTLLPLPPTYPS